MERWGYKYTAFSVFNRNRPVNLLSHGLTRHRCDVPGRWRRRCNCLEPESRTRCRCILPHKNTVGYNSSFTFRNQLRSRYTTTDYSRANSAPHNSGVINKVVPPTDCFATALTNQATSGWTTATSSQYGRQQTNRRLRRRTIRDNDGTRNNSRAYTATRSRATSGQVIRR